MMKTGSRFPHTTMMLSLVFVAASDMAFGQSGVFDGHSHLCFSMEDEQVVIDTKTLRDRGYGGLFFCLPVDRSKTPTLGKRIARETAQIRELDPGPGFSKALNGNLYYTLITEEEQAIYRSVFKDGVYQQAERLPSSVNISESQFDGVISPDESYLIYCVYNHELGYGSADLFVSLRDDQDQWSPAKNLGPLVNTTYVDGPASISPDGKYIFYSSVNGESAWARNRNDYQELKEHFSVAGHGSRDVFRVAATFIDHLKPL